MLNLGAVGFGARAQHMFGLMQKIDPGARLASLVEPAKASVLANRPEAAEATWYDDVTSMLDGEKLDGVLVAPRTATTSPRHCRLLSAEYRCFSRSRSSQLGKTWRR